MKVSISNMNGSPTVADIRFILKNGLSGLYGDLNETSLQIDWLKMSHIYPFPIGAKFLLITKKVKSWEVHRMKLNVKSSPDYFGNCWTQRR